MRRMRKMVLILVLIVIARGANAQVPTYPMSWRVSPSGVSASLRGLSVASASKSPHGPVVWASGSGGTILRSDDRGKIWKQLHVEGAEKLDFRGIRAFNEKIAYAISIGEGDKSRIYKTIDGGGTWELQYTDKRSAFFLDDIVCFTEKNCFVLGDPIEGKFLMLSTEDGRHWSELPRENMPAIIPGEGAFAASGTSLAVFGKSDIYFGTGGGATARVFHSPNFGRDWSVADTPLAAGNASSGVFSVLRVRNTVVAVGGDYKATAEGSHAAAISMDGGATWKLAAAQPGGFRSAVASVDGLTLVSVGPNGADLSDDLGMTWKPTQAANLNSVAVSHAKNIWGVGAKGMIATLLEIPVIVDSLPPDTQQN
jgi:photosystem II stability/assembly factor-like uncharacterized protein